MLAGLYAKDHVINDYKWIIPRGNGSCKRTGGTMQLKIIVPEGKSKGGSYQVGKLKNKVSLKGYRYIRFSARSTDRKNHIVYFYLRRSLAPDDQANFYSMVETSSKWQTYYLCLETKRGKRSAGFFAFAKGSPNCNIELSKGGELLSIQLAVKESANIEIKDIRLTSDRELNNNPVIERIAEKIKDHVKFKPYCFQNIIKPNAVALAGFQIVIRKNASSGERFAAKELSKYLKKVTGTEFPVTVKPNAPRVIRLEVKPGKPEEGFSIQLLDGRSLTITGNSPRGLVYAVYDFLEKATGIRWFAPFDYGEVVPFNPDLKLPLFKDRSWPLMTYRCSHYCSNGRIVDSNRHRWNMADWAFKNKFNVELERLSNQETINNFYDKRGTCIWLPEHAGHNFHKWIPPAKYFKNSPEFFCFDKTAQKWRANRVQLCTTNSRLIVELGKIADDYFKRCPNDQYFPLFQEDGSRLWCQCPACLALNPSGCNLASASENNINLANKVCQEIRKYHPNKGVFTYAYHETAFPPQNILPVPGVRIMYCYYSDGSPIQLPWNSQNGQYILRWSELTNGNVVAYTYHYLNPRYAYNNGNTLINMFRFFNIIGIQGCNQESCEYWGGIDSYLIYLGSRLAWNPWFDEEQFKDDYFNKLYGKAYSPMRKFFDLLSKKLCDKSLWLRFGFGRYPFVPSPVLKQLEYLISSAKKLAGSDSRVLKAVAAQEKYLQFLKSYSYALKAGDNYYQAPTLVNYQVATKAVSELRQMSGTLFPKRIISGYITKTYDAWQRDLDASWREQLSLKKLGTRFKIIKPLNPWKFKADKDGSGDREKWFAAKFDDSKWKSIESGKSWEIQGHQAYDGIAWYRKTLIIPETDSGICLYFGGVDERAWIYLDGKYIGGHHKGAAGDLWNEPFTIMFPHGTSPGKHQLTVKVIDSAGQGGIWKPVYLLEEK